MKIGYSQICINPLFPIKQAGFMYAQVKPVFNFHDDLHARILAFDDDQTLHLHISFDLLGFPLEIQEALLEQIQAKTSKKVTLTTSSTHTHFSGNYSDPRYLGQIMQQCLEAVDYMVFEEADTWQITYQCIPFEGVGKSRISNHQARVLLQLMILYKNNQPRFGMIIHNCHPTIMNDQTKFFSSEYPGYVIAELKRRYPTLDFTFLQGAAGDVSTRFTRDDQSYESVKKLGNNLVEKIVQLLDTQPLKEDLSSIVYDQEIVMFDHEFVPIDLSTMPSQLSERELITIDQGNRIRQSLSTKPESLAHFIKVSCLQLGTYRLVFCPNELFSSYIDAIDITKSCLVCYSNGYHPYVTGLNDHFVTYERFTDTLTLETKQRYRQAISKFGK